MISGRLPQENGSAAVVLVMGPLYHLPSAADRVASLREAFRVLAGDGIAAVTAISRYASALDGLARKLSLDPRFVKIRDRDLADGQASQRHEQRGLLHDGILSSAG